VAHFQRKYDRGEIAAAVSAVLDSGLKAEEAVAAAAAGALPGRGQGLPPFEINVHTLKSYLTDERRRRRAIEVAGMAPALALDRATGELVAMIDRELERCRGLQAKGRLRAADVREVAAAAREVGKLVRELPPRASTPGETGNGKRSKEGDAGQDGSGGDFIGALAGETGANGTGRET
jgi:hypothetical protein